MEKVGCGKVATVIGRYYAMDRDNRWERVEVAYNALTKGEGDQRGEDAPAMIQKSYDEGVTDEFIKPIIVTENGQPVATVGEGDSIIFYLSLIHIWRRRYRPCRTGRTHGAGPSGRFRSPNPPP